MVTWKALKTAPVPSGSIIILLHIPQLWRTYPRDRFPGQPRNYFHTDRVYRVPSSLADVLRPSLLARWLLTRLPSRSVLAWPVHEAVQREARRVSSRARHTGPARHAFVISRPVFHARRGWLATPGNRSWISRRETCWVRAVSSHVPAPGKERRDGGDG